MLQSRRHGDEYIFPNGAILTEFAFTFRTITQTSIFFICNAFISSKREREAFLFLFHLRKAVTFWFFHCSRSSSSCFSIRETKSWPQTGKRKETAGCLRDIKFQKKIRYRYIELFSLWRFHEKLLTSSMLMRSRSTDVGGIKCSYITQQICYAELIKFFQTISGVFCAPRWGPTWVWATVLLRDYLICLNWMQSKNSSSFG